MPIKGQITTRGFEEYLEAIAKAGQDVDAAADRALQAGAQVALRGMERRIPFLTGWLKSHLYISDLRVEGNFHYVEVGLSLKDRKAIYGVYQEFGTSEMSAQPFIRPTFDEDKAAIRRAMKESLESEGVI
jgi:HK97 gp10 family phage protein